MSALYMLIGFSLVLGIGFVIAFVIWVGSGQADDTYTPSVRILLDDKIKNSDKNGTTEV